MFSSGVYLGMHGAEQGAAVVDGALREPAREAALQRDLERRLVKGLDEFKWFIYRFTSPTMKYLFANPRNTLNIERAVVAMLAGDVFDSPREIGREHVCTPGTHAHLVCTLLLE